MRIRRDLILLALLGASLCGCTLLPTRADLGAVHEAYRSDFAGAFTADAPAAGNVALTACTPATGKFQKSLEAMRDFEAKYRNDSSMEQQLGHITVLKAMIHLQSGNFGIARSLEPAVAQARLASSQDSQARDVLLQKAYPSLVDGWQAACETQRSAGGTLVHDGPATFGPDRQLSAVLSAAASGVVAVAAGVASPDKRPGAAADDGAIYLATTAAVFRYYGFRLDSDECLQQADASACRDLAVRKHGQELADADAAIRTLLSIDERQAAEEELQSCAARPRPSDIAALPAGDKFSKVVLPSRLRYVAWYQLLERTRFGCRA